MNALTRWLIIAGLTLILISSLSQIWLVQTDYRIKVPAPLKYAVYVGWALFLPAVIASDKGKEKNRIGAIALAIAAIATFFGSLRIGAA